MAFHIAFYFVGLVGGKDGWATRTPIGIQTLCSAADYITIRDRIIMIDDGKILQLTELLREAARPKKIILFGSQARREADARSDLDILIVEPSVKNRVAEMVRLNRVVSPLRVPVDLLVVSEETYEYWSGTPGNVYYQARTQGKTLYEAA